MNPGLNSGASEVLQTASAYQIWFTYENLPPQLVTVVHPAASPDRTYMFEKAVMKPRISWSSGMRSGNHE